MFWPSVHPGKPSEARKSQTTTWIRQTHRSSPTPLSTSSGSWVSPAWRASFTHLRWRSLTLPGSPLRCAQGSRLFTSAVSRTQLLLHLTTCWHCCDWAAPIMSKPLTRPLNFHISWSGFTFLWCFDRTFLPAGISSCDKVLKTAVISPSPNL